MTLSTIILAAGKGTRMRSNKPKVLQTLGGKPLLQHVIHTVQQLSTAKTVVVYGFAGNQVQQAFADQPITWVEQHEQLGTGHAVKVALDEIPTQGKSLILYGDVPLIQATTLQQLADANKTGLAMLTLTVANPYGLGRIVRNHAGKVQCIVEQKDATATQQAIQEINSGIYCIDNTLLHNYLPQLSNHNAQQEYYLTDIIKMAVDDGIEIATIEPKHPFEIDGVNDRGQLAQLERTWQTYQVQQLQKQGVQFADPTRVDIRGTLTVGQDVFIDTNVIIQGECHLGNHVVIETGCVLTHSQIGDNSHIKPYCVIDNSQLGQAVTVGPFAHLRPHTQLADAAKIGNFVETKKSVIGKGSKVNHLSYIGDAHIGEAANIGAGTITCNYDGKNKHKTQIGNHAFIGSNSSLVAPVNIDDEATVGAGSVITQDINKQCLGVARGRQRNIDNYYRPDQKS